MRDQLQRSSMLCEHYPVRSDERTIIYCDDSTTSRINACVSNRVDLYVFIVWKEKVFDSLRWKLFENLCKWNRLRTSLIRIEIYYFVTAEETPQRGRYFSPESVFGALDYDGSRKKPFARNNFGIIEMWNIFGNRGAKYLRRTSVRTALRIVYIIYTVRLPLCTT